MLMKLLKNKRLLKYFAMAMFVVAIELTTFQIIDRSSSNNYRLATAISFSLAVVLNWVLGRLLVFGKSHHHPTKEFGMVLVGSLVGLAIQLAVVTICVEQLHLYPLLGKMASIGFSFFWNYWFRARFVYISQPEEADAIR
jgi:putative flippase GtrA